MNVFLLRILVFNNLKSTTGLLLFVSFLVINITGEVWLVLFLDNIPNDTDLAFCSSINPLSISFNRNGLTKKGDSLITFMSAVRLGQAPISSLKLNASLYFTINFISLAFSFGVKWGGTDLFSHKESGYLSEISMDHLVLAKVRVYTFQWISPFTSQ